MAIESTFKKDTDDSASIKKKLDGSISNNARFKAHDLVDRTADRAEVMEKALGEKADYASENLGEKRDQVERALKKQYVSVRRKAKENPLLTVGIAFAAGAVVSRLISRK